MIHAPSAHNGENSLKTFSVKTFSLKKHKIKYFIYYRKNQVFTLQGNSL